MDPNLVPESMYMTDKEMEMESMDPNHYYLFADLKEDTQSESAVIIKDEVDIDWSEQAHASQDTPRPIDSNFTVLRRSETVVKRSNSYVDGVTLIKSNRRKIRRRAIRPYYNKTQYEESKSK